MFFSLSKIFGFFAQPSNAIAMVCAAGIALLLVRRARAGARLLASGVALLLVCGYSPIGTVLLLSLSERFPAWQFDGREPYGIIVLGGAIDSNESLARDALELGGAAERIVATIELARRYPNMQIVFTGGSSNLVEASIAEAPIAGRAFERFGIARERLTLETQSRTTDENAAFTRRLVSPLPGQRWLLLTSAFHMPRSIGVFRAAGFDVEAYPVDWRTAGWIDAARPFGTLSDGLARTDLALHEWTGLMVYWLTGRSMELLPAPKP